MTAHIIRRRCRAIRARSRSRIRSVRVRIRRSRRAVMLRICRRSRRIASSCRARRCMIARHTKPINVNT